MAVPLLSPGRHHGDAAFGNVDTASHHDSMNRLSPGVNSRNSSYRTSAVGSSSASIHTAGEAALMDRQRSASRISLRPSYERLSMANGSTATASSNPDSVAAAAVPVAAIGKVNVTDPWGTAWGMDSPYDASVAYAMNPNRITMRQSAYFGSGLTLASLAGPNPIYYPSSSSMTSMQHPSNMPSTSDGTLHPQMAASPAPSTFSSISGSQASSGNANVWSEVSSARSFNGVTPPSAPWVNDSNNGHNKRRSVSFQGDLSQFAVNGGVPSPTYSSDSYSSSNVPSSQHPHQQHPQHPQMPNLRARSTTHLPTLLKQHRHSTAAVPMNRRTLSTPGSEADRNAFRKSFIGGSVVNQSHQSASLPPVPVDPKVLAKQTKKSSSSLNGRSLSANTGGGSGVASSRASIMSSTTDRTDALSTMSGVSEGGKKSKRKSWFARSPSFLAVETSSINSTSASSSNIQPQRSNTRRSTESLSATSHLSSSTTNSKPPALSRAGSSFNTFNGSPPPPTPPIPDTLPLPITSLNDKSRKSSNNSLKNRLNGHPGSGSSTPSPSAVEMTTALSSHQAVPVVNPSLGVSTAGPPATPHGSRISKTQTTPSVYGTPLASPASTAHGGSQSNGNTYGAPTSSSPLSMSPMTSPTSASSKPLKPAASARPSALQLPTHEEHSMQPDSFPSPTTHSESLSRHNTEEVNLLQPNITMSLPPTPITESGPGGPGRNALAPAAVIKASPSSPPALGSLAALADAERASMHMQSPTQTPTVNNSRARISPSQRGRSSSRPTSPLTPQEHQQRGASLQAMESSNAPHSSPKGSVHAEITNTTTSSPATSRKASNNSLRATLRQAPPSPEPSSAIVEHMPSESQDDQFLPMGPPENYQSVNTPPPLAEPVGKSDGINSAAPPHQPTLNMSLSSFAPRKAFPVSTGSSINSNMTITPLPRKSSAQSVLPETVPLPDSPAVPQDGFVMNAHPMDAQMPLQPRGLAPQPNHIGDKNGTARPLKPRASSPNLQNKSTSQTKATSGKPLPSTQSSTNKATGIPTSKSSKSPFNLFKRSRSKTLGDGSLSPSEAAAAQLYATPPAMPVRSPSSNPYESSMPTGSSPNQPISTVQMTPAQTPQLSFSSSTTSTMAGSEPSDQFYADFAPDSRPSFSNHGAIAGNRDVTLKKSVPASNSSHHQQHQYQQPHNKTPLNSTHTQSGHNTAKGAFSRMFGTSKRK